MYPSQCISTNKKQPIQTYFQRESKEPSVKMTPQFYARYIPPTDDSEDSRSAKKLKSDLGHGENARNVNLIKSTVEQKKDAAQTMHNKVLAKYEKSIKSAVNDTNNSDVQPNVRVATPKKLHPLLPIPQPAQVPEPFPPSALSALPLWMTNPVNASSFGTLPFEELSFDPTTTASLKARGFSKAFAMQNAVFQLLRPGPRQHKGDLCIAAPTGSGKTLAYALPMVEALGNGIPTKLRGLVVVPTRELVHQARKTLEFCGKAKGLKIGTSLGGKGFKEEQELLIGQDLKYDPDAYRQEQLQEEDEDAALLNWDEDQFEASSSTQPKLVGYVPDYFSNVNILVCTPGRLVEHMEHTRGFTLEHVKWLVIDEVDRLLEDGFQQWVSTVIPALEYLKPPTDFERRMTAEFHVLRKREVRKILLSATMTRDVDRLKDLKLRRPSLVVFQGDQDSNLRVSDTRGSNADREVPNEAKANLRASDEISLPSSLHEIAIPIRDGENKPLYLIELIKDFSLLSSRGSKEKVRNLADERSEDANVSDRMDTDDISDHDSIPDITSSSGSSSSSDTVSDSDPDISMEDGQNHIPTEKLRGSLIFARSTESAHRLSRLLSLLAPQQASSAATLTKSSTKSSEKVLSQFRDGKLDTIITTDRASRGLDLQNLTYVINYDMPSSINSYVHRVGRTARAGRTGTAITLVGWTEGRWFWNEIGRGSTVQRGNKKVARKYMREEGWNDEEKRKYSDALAKLGEETKAEGK
ncbi:ATP-dependent RNA helicase dbp6 [Xanthoria parietina]